MQNTRANRRRAYVISEANHRKTIVIDVTRQELEQIKKGRLPIEKVKDTKEFLVYRKAR